MGFYVNKVTDKKLLDFFCPVCGKNQFNRIALNKFDKVLRFLSFGKRASSKFECSDCKYTVLLPASKVK